MLGGFLALVSAAMFALDNATARRGVLHASVAQALSITIPLGVPILFVAAWASGALATISAFSGAAVLWLSLAGVLHFVWGRYCNYRATKAMGSNLVAPVQQCSLIVTLALAIWILDEWLTPLRVVGIALVLLGPALTYERGRKKPANNGEAAAAASAVDVGKPVLFQPHYAEGYFFAALSSTGYGVSPVLVRLGLEDHGLGSGLVGGLISYVAATLAFGLVLLWPGQLRHVRAVGTESAKWFAVSAVFVCLGQTFRYMALAIAPVSVVVPIQRLSLLMRLYFSRLINPHHEVFGGRVIAATIVSLTGAVALSVSTDTVQSLVPLPDWATAVLNWHWP